MKALAGLLSLGLAGYAGVGALEAPIYTFGSLSGTSNDYATTPSVSPETARLLLARRLGLSQYHDLRTPDESVLKILNTFGGNQKELFMGGEKDEDSAKLLIVVEGINDPGRISEKETFSPVLAISNPPSSSNTARLLADFLEQRYEQDIEFSKTSGMHRLKNAVDIAKLGGFNGGLDYLASILNPKQHEAQGAHHTTEVLYIREIEEIARKDGIESEIYSTALESLRKTLRSLKALDGTSREATVVLMPLRGKNAKQATDTYGSYKGLERRQNGRRQQIEEPLSVLSTPKPSSPLSKSPIPSQPQTLKASSSPKGLLPVCYANYDSCISTTDSCSGHGTCQLKYTNKNSQNSDCFACVCTPSVRTNENGLIKHIYWGGSACQKKDVSSPFFLLAGLTVALVAIVSWGVGLLFSIGQEDLPSVIGAGVTGPRAQK